MALEASAVAAVATKSSRMAGYCQDTPVFHPTKEEFSKPFCQYINKVLKKHPDVAMFKVVPPEGWRPRRCERLQQ